MKKVLLGAVLSLAVMGAMAVGGGTLQAHAAMTQTQIQALIQQLLGQVQQLQSQITAANANGGQVSVIAGSNYSPACTIVPPLQLGSRGPMVSLLQNALHQEGSYADGFVTGYYGQLTVQAVKKFQAEKSLSVTGSVDQATADALNALIPTFISLCAPSVQQTITGTLQAAGASTAMWGTHVLYPSAQLPSSPVVSVYRVKASSDAVLSALNQYQGQVVTLTGTVQHFNIEGGFWGIIASNVAPVSSTTPSAPITVTSPSAGQVWKVGETHTIVWSVGTTSSNFPGTVTIVTDAPIPGCVYSTPACMIAIHSQPYTIAQSVPNTGSYTWTIPATLPAANIGSQAITVVLDGTNTKGASGAFTIASSTTPPTSTLSIQTTTVPNGTVGQPYSANIVATGGTGNYTWSIEGSLPNGITQSQRAVECFRAPCSQPLILQGAPTTAGTYAFTAQVSDGTNSAQQAFSIIVASSTPSGNLAIVTQSLPSGTVGQLYNASLQATGGSGNYQWSVVSGALPPGTSIRNVAPCTSNVCPMIFVQPSLSGTPTIAGAYTFTLQVSSGGQTATQPMAIVVNPSPSFKAITILSPLTGSSFTVGGTITSVPFAWMANYPVVSPIVQLNDSFPGSAPYTASISFVPGTDKQFGSIPASVFSASGQYSITVCDAGTPGFGESLCDRSSFAVAVASGSQQSISVTSPSAGNTWIAGSVHQITWDANQNVWMLKLYKGGAFVQTIVTFTQDASWYSWTIPSAVLSGNNYTIRAYAKDGVTYGESGQFAIVNTAIPPSVIPTPIIPITPIVPISSTPNPTGTLAIATSAYLPTATVSQPYTTTIAATGGSAPYTWTFVSSDQSNFGQSGFPAGSGLSFNGGTGSSATISGTPSALATGHEYPFTVKVTSGGQTASQSFVLYVSPGTSNGTGFAASVVLVTPPNWQQPGTVGQPYSATFLAANEPEGTYQWNIASGTLPPGLSLTGGTGSQTTIAGRPTTAGSYTFTLRVSSTYGGSTQNQYNITIYPSTVTPPLTTSGGGVSVQDGGASSQQSALMASVLESIKGILDQIQKLAL